MLNFLKKILQIEEEQDTKKSIQLGMQDLDGWVVEKSKPLMGETRRHIEEILMKVNDELELARLNVEALENAKLQNPNIPFKAKQYMEGNRKVYIRAVNSFLGHLEINNKDYFYLLGFCKLFDELINSLNKGTIRSYTILQEFFANETNKIVQNLKKFDMIFAELKSALNSEKVVAANGLRNRIEELEYKIKQKISIMMDFKNREAVLKLANTEKDDVMKKIGEFSISDEHNNFLKLSEEKKAQAAAFYIHQSQILQSFSVLERPLRKYSHVAFEHEEAVLDYLKHPIETLVRDKDLRILEILKNMEKLLAENKLQIDEKKKEKSLEETKKLSKDFLEQFLDMHFSFKTKIEDLDSKIKATGVQEKFKNFNDQLEEINTIIENSNEEYLKLKNEAAKSENAIEILKNDLESSIRKIFGEEVKIVI